MNMRITSDDLEDILFERRLPVDFKSEAGIEEKQTMLDHKFGSASFREVWFEGIHISHGNMQLHENIDLRMQSDSSVVEMHFSLSGKSSAAMLGNKRSFSFSDQQHNVYYMPSFEGTLSAEKHKEANRVFEIHFTENYFKRLTGSGNAILENFASQMDRKQVSIMSEQNMNITNQMHVLVNEIIHCQQSGPLKRIFLEAKALELLMLQIEQFGTATLQKKNAFVKDYDIEKIHHAKYLLEQNLQNPYSLTDLAHQVALNDFKLKKGFKELFNTTVFSYLRELRMQEAWRMLFDENRAVKDVAEYCGYEHVQHFSTAFKKKFGVTPGKIRA
jgi:AraC-like DNA-binding protein